MGFDILYSVGERGMPNIRETWFGKGKAPFLSSTASISLRVQLLATYKKAFIPNLKTPSIKFGKKTFFSTLVKVH